jgi:hypothetical protein
LTPSFGKDWNQQLEGTTFPLALDLLRLLSISPYHDLFSLLRIDVSHAKDKSYGTREVVLLIEEPYDRKVKRRVFLRLTPRNYAQELGNYLELRKNLIHQPVKISPSGKPLPQVVDLRIPQLAFIEN